jgi:hypothetical protein
MCGFELSLGQKARGLIVEAPNGTVVDHQIRKGNTCHTTSIPEVAEVPDFSYQLKYFLLFF